jgi:hypothetical protein
MKPGFDGQERSGYIWVTIGRDGLNLFTVLTRRRAPPPIRRLSAQSMIAA